MPRWTDTCQTLARLATGAVTVRNIIRPIGWKITERHTSMAGDLSTGKFKYFSYGSNLLRERILINNPTAVLYGVGKLHGHKFAFDLPRRMDKEDKEYWHGAGATIRAGNPDDYVYGVVWEIATDQMKNLDKQEMGYDALEVTVHLDHGEIIPCRVYEMDRDTWPGILPSPHYKQIILAGAKQNRLPEDYIKHLESFPDNGTTSMPPRFLAVVDSIKKFRAEKGSIDTSSGNSDPHPLDDVIALFLK